MLVLNAEVLFVGSLVFLHVVSVVRGGRSSRVEGGRRGWAPRGHLAVKAGGGGGSGRQRRAALNADFIPDDEAPALMISLELALAAQALVHDKAQAPSSAPPQPGPLRGGPDSGAGTAQ